jgi:type IV pilus assembly protein PilM
MSFWEDRFVDRPHASAMPSHEPTDLNEQHAEEENPYPSAGHAWSEIALPEAEPVARQPFGFSYVAPVEELVDEDLDAAPEADELEQHDEPAVEYRRTGLFRRRRPVPVEAEAEPAADDIVGEHEAEPAFAAYNGNGSHGATWTIVEPEAEAASEDEYGVEVEEPEVEYRRRGIFRRRRPVPVESEPENEPENEPRSEAEEHAAWVAYTPYVELSSESDESDEADELAETEAPAVEYRRRGLFRRRTPVVVEASEEVSDDAVDESVDEMAEESVAGEPELDTETDELEATRLAALALEDETAAEKPRRRGLFRRKQKEQEVGEEGPEEPESVEDDSFENVTFEPATTVYAQAEDDAAAADVEQDDHDDSWSEPAEEQAEPVSYESDEAWAPQVVAESAEEQMPVEDAPVLDEPEPELAPEHDVADELEPVAVAMSAESEEPAAELSAFEPEYPEFDPEPVPQRKKNGRGGPRGKKVVGLKVGASQLAAAVVAGGSNGHALVDVARRPLEHGVVVDGELRDAEALTHALKSFFKDHGLPVKNVRLGLSSSRVGVRTFEISGIEDGARFDNAVRFKAHEVLPVAAHESVLDYRVVEERYTESGEVSRRVLLVVAPRDQVEPYFEACRAAGLRLAGVDLESFGLLRAFVPPLGGRSRSEDSATVVVAVGHEASTLLVAGGGVCEFTRVFDWGGGALQEAIAEELEVPLMEAATILAHLSLSGPGRHLDSLDADARGRALQAVRARLTPFARELVSSLQFYQTQPESLGIREILITGGTSHLEGLADVLHQMIGVNVSVGDPLGRVTVQTEIPAQLDAQIGSLAVPIGLAIEDDPARSVNLLPKEARQTRKRPNTLAVAAPLAAAVPLVALAFLFVQANGTVSDRQSELDAVRSQIAALPEPTRPNIDPTLAGEAATRATAVAQILGGRLSWERVLGDVSRVLPTGVSLTELSATAPQPTTPEVAATTDGSTPAPAPVTTTITPTGVTITGYAFEYATIARTLARIQAVPSLTNVQLQSATPQTLGKKRIIEFTIAADLATSGGAVQ